MGTPELLSRRASRPTRLATALGLALAVGSGAFWSTTITAAVPDAADTNRVMLNRGITSGDLERRIAAVRGSTPAAAGSSAMQPNATINVYNCDNSGNGSLRNAVAQAQSGDTINLSTMTCDTINLSSSIITSVDNLSIVGNMGDPEDKYPAISGGNVTTPIVHDGTGTLTLSGVSVKFGKFSFGTSTTLYGGCIASQGNVVLKDFAKVKYCTTENTGSGDAIGGGIYSAGRTTLKNGASVTLSKAVAGDGRAAGGGIYAAGGVTLEGSVISENSARATSGVVARGGGVYSGESLTMKYSIISNNEARGDNGVFTVAGGGASVQRGTTLIRNSSIYGNTAPAAAGLLLGQSGSGTTTIQSSTISGNTATDSNSKYGGSGIWVGNKTKIVNSTISGNAEQNDEGNKYGAVSVAAGKQLELSSTIVGGNTLTPTGGTATASDLWGQGSSPLPVTGSNNLVAFFTNISVPDDTLVLVDPKLGPLADNGGLTPTMTLLPTSPAIDAGKSNGLQVDQRGSGYPRVIGSAADIGAFEWNDVIFVNGFD